MDDGRNMAKLLRLVVEVETDLELDKNEVTFVYTEMEVPSYLLHPLADLWFGAWQRSKSVRWIYWSLA